MTDERDGAGVNLGRLREAARKLREEFVYASASPFLERFKVTEANALLAAADALLRGGGRGATEKEINEAYFAGDGGDGNYDTTRDAYTDGWRNAEKHHGIGHAAESASGGHGASDDRTLTVSHDLIHKLTSLLTAIGADEQCRLHTMARNAAGELRDLFRVPAAESASAPAASRSDAERIDQLYAELRMLQQREAERHQKVVDEAHRLLGDEPPAASPGELYSDAWGDLAKPGARRPAAPVADPPSDAPIAHTLHCSLCNLVTQSTEEEFETAAAAMKEHVRTVHCVPTPPDYPSAERAAELLACLDVEDEPGTFFLGDFERGKHTEMDHDELRALLLRAGEGGAR